MLKTDYIFINIYKILWLCYKYFINIYNVIECIIIYIYIYIYMTFYTNLFLFAEKLNVKIQPIFYIY